MLCSFDWLCLLVVSKYNIWDMVALMFSNRDQAWIWGDCHDTKNDGNTRAMMLALRFVLVDFT